MDGEYREFATKSEKVFAKEDLSKYPYFERLRASRERRNFLRAIQSRGSAVSSPVILAPTKEGVVQTAGLAIRAYLWSLGVGLSLWLTMILIRVLDHEKLKLRDKRDEQLQSLLLSRFYRPRRNHYGPAVLIDINVLCLQSWRSLAWASLHSKPMI
jgi:hypothetical protein